MLERYLDDLEGRLDDAGEALHLDAWKRFWADGPAEGIFEPRRPYAAPSRLDWPVIPINDAVEAAEPDLQILRELKAASDLLARGSGGILNVRANYGTAILPSLFGSEVFMMERAMDTLPTVRPMGAERALKLPEAGIPSLEKGFGRKVFDFTERYRSLMVGHPRVRRWVRPYHPDLQSALDATELLFGSELFLSVCDAPDAVKAVLRLVTDTYGAFMDRWLAAAGKDPEIDLGDGEVYTTHWNFLVKGRLMLRSDSAMNFSPAMYGEFILPYDRELLARFGGGAVHFCGRGDHYIGPLSETPGLTAVHMSQPEYNDMERIFSCTVDKDLRLFGMLDDAVRIAWEKGRPLRGRVSARDFLRASL